jgi:energy-coupling factor transport system ATP-binding protein
LVFQDPENQAVMNSVEREIAFGLENLGTPSAAISRLVEESLISMGLTPLRRASLRSLSGGELQKVALASVLAMQPHLLLLDEPTSQLDPISSEELLSALRRLLEDTGSTVVLAEHRSERCLHLATRVLYMEQGGIVQDSSPAEFCRWALRNHPEFLPPVTRLLGTRKNGHKGEAGDQGCTLRDGALIPLTVQKARVLLEADGMAVRSARIAAPPDRQAGDCLLETRDLAVGYAPDLPLLERVNLRLHAGECIALMGENGCGKSTLIKHFNGLLTPLKGRVSLGGKDIKEYSVASASRLCGLLGQNPNDYFVKDCVREELLHTVRHHGFVGPEQTALMERTVAELALEDLLDRDPRELSGGERSRVALATVSVTRPPVMVLDEPTRGIDPSSKARLGRILTEWAEDGRCVVVVTHDVEFAARHAQRVILLGSGGVLADGPPHEVLDGALYFSTQINRLLRHRLPGVLVEPDVEVICS